MTSLKTWCLLPLTVLLLLSVAPTVTEVAKSMSDCHQFLLQETPPHIPGILENGTILDHNRYKPICQTYDNKRTFVTLYDTENKIPVFSAYKYRGEGDSKKVKKRSVMLCDTENKITSWMIEPQLEGSHMKYEEYSHQAINNDYKNVISYEKSHLFPCSHAFDECAKRSVFTLTNVVPQEKTFNKGRWQKMESCVKCVLEKYCINSTGVIEGYIVTGAKPSNNSKLNNRVNIPSVLWSAFCCYSHKEKSWLASAHWDYNTKSSSEYLQTKTLAELRQKLSIDVFPRTKCPLNETVAVFHSEMNCDKRCQCPRRPPESMNPQFLEFLHNSRLPCLRRRRVKDRQHL